MGFNFKDSIQFSIKPTVVKNLKNSSQFNLCEWNCCLFELDHLQDSMYVGSRNNNAYFKWDTIPFGVIWLYCNVSWNVDIIQLLPSTLDAYDDREMKWNQNIANMKHVK